MIRNPAANDNESWLPVGGEIMLKVLNPYVITTHYWLVLLNVRYWGLKTIRSQTDLKKLNSNFSMNTNIASAFLDL